MCIYHIRESHKIKKYSTLVQSQGGEFSPLVTGTSGSTTTSTKKILQVVCTNQDNADPRFTYEYWMAKISLSLQKSAANEIQVRSKAANGKQYSTSTLRETFPDSADIHLQMNG